MIQVAIVKRRLKEGKTYEDFRKVWYHTTGFGTSNKMLTVINGADPREIIVIGLTEANLEQARELIAIDTKERGDHPLDGIIEPEVDRTFGVLIAEDDFSGTGAIKYQPAMVNGEITDMTEIAKSLQEGTRLLAKLRPDIQLGVEK
jgi:hypothetical protein